MIANRLREIREEAGLSQAELAEKSGVSRTILSFLETNKDVNCKISTLKAISAALSRPISDIFF